MSGESVHVDDVGPLEGIELRGERIHIDGRPMRYQGHVMRYQEKKNPVNVNKFWCVCSCGYICAWRPFLYRAEEAAAVHLIGVAIGQARPEGGEGRRPGSGVPPPGGGSREGGPNLGG
jgi:hypothetical protein